MKLKRQSNIKKTVCIIVIIWYLREGRNENDQKPKIRENVIFESACEYCDIKYGKMKNTKPRVSIPKIEIKKLIV